MIRSAIPQDGDAIESITNLIDVFSDEEKKCVPELWDEYITLGSEKSGYYFIVSVENDTILGYACYGLRALTDGTYDLYWIAVDPNGQGKGIGRKLLEGVERNILQMGGNLIFVETSGTPKYELTRHFYLKVGYNLAATIRDFYSRGDDLVIFTKHLT